LIERVYISEVAITSAGAAGIQETGALAREFPMMKEAARLGKPSPRHAPPALRDPLDLRKRGAIFMASFAAASIAETKTGAARFNIR
jgi:hypothetical protein